MKRIKMKLEIRKLKFKTNNNTHNQRTQSHDSTYTHTHTTIHILYTHRIPNYCKEEMKNQIQKRGKYMVKINFIIQINRSD